MNVNERQLLSARHAVAQPSRVSGGCGVLLYSRSPSSAQVSFAGGFGFGVADVQLAGDDGLEVDVLLGEQVMGDAVMVLVVVRFAIVVG